MKDLTYSIFAIIISLLFSFFLGYGDILGLCCLTFVAYFIVSRCNMKNVGIRLNVSRIFLYVTILSYVLFVIGWHYYLKTANADAAYDPARYYYMAKSASEGKGFNMLFNYVGIVYFYKALFDVFGSNPLNCVILNNVLTITSAFYLVKLLNLIDDSLSPKSKKRLFLLVCFIPELLWYNCLSSREIICMACVTYALYGINVILSKKHGTGDFILLFASILLLGIIRTSLLILVIFVFALTAMYHRRQMNKFMLIVAIASLAAVVIIAPQISQELGSADFDYNEKIEAVASGESKNLDEYSWSSNSIGRLLVANSFSELLYLSPFRIAAYIVTPLPQLSVNISSLVDQDYQEWQKLWVILSSLFYLFSIPNIISVILHAFHDKKGRYCAFLLLATFFVISCGVSIIHERYRITGIPILLLAIIYGKSLQQYKQKSIKITFAIGIAAVVGVIAIKLF